MNTPMIINNSTGKIDPSQFISIQVVPKGDGTSRILGFTPLGNVYEFKTVNSGTHYSNECWCIISTGVFQG